MAEPATTSAGPLAQQTFVMASWLAGHKALGAVLQVLTVAVLARHLEAADFGLVALVQVLLSGVLAIGYGGITTYVVCEQRNQEDDRTDAAFWVGALMTAAGVMLFVLCIPLITWLSPHQLTMPVGVAAMAAIVLGQLRAVPEGLLKRGLKYDTLVIRDAIFDTASSLLQIGMVLTGFGIWSLVMPSVAVQAVRLVVTYRLARWIPRLRLGREHWRDVFRYGGNITGTNVLGLVANEGDTILVGTFLGTAALGVYNLAWRLANLPGRYISNLVTDLAVPVFARFADDPARFNAAYRRTVKLICAAAFPLLIGLFVFADEAVALVYGPRWSAAVLPLRIFILFSLQRVAMAPVGALVYVKRRPEVAFWFNMSFVPFYLTSIAIGAAWGVVGVAAGVTISRIVGGHIWYRVASRAAAVSSQGIVRDVVGAVSLSLGMAGALLLIPQIGGALNVSQVPLPVLAGAGIVVYICLLGMYDRRFLVECIELCRPYWARPYALLRSYVTP